VLSSVGTWGSTAVWLFFILSGFVLAWSFTKNTEVDYGTYIVRRLTRLYIPVWGAVLFAVVTMIFVSRNVQGLGDWVASHPARIELRHVVSDLTLLGGTGSNITPLWSLRWEVFFSVLLILYVLVARKINPWVMMSVCYVLSIAGSVIGNQLLLYMPMFGMGVAVAFAWGRIQEIAVRVTQWFTRAPHVAALLIVATLLGVVALQSLPQELLGSEVPDAVKLGATTALRLLSVATIVVLVAVSKTIGRVFMIRPIAWLGRISFSLYLVHEIVLLAGVYSTSANPTAIAVAVVACFPVAWVFLKVVEEPAHKLSKRIGSRRMAPATA
ncbi:TPA: acyltransferase, partial [Shigella flexneri]|nr:acyltransferase [Shigella flexneri]